MMSERSLEAPTRARVAHRVPGRVRVQIDSPRGQGRLHRLADELRQMPETERVRANHVARSVTVTYDPTQTSAVDLLERLQRLGLVVLNLSDPFEWGEFLAEEVVPHVEDPNTLPGRINLGLRDATGGLLDLARLTAAVLVITAGLQLRGALLRREAIPWLRVATYLLAALSLLVRKAAVRLSEAART